MPHYRCVACRYRLHSKEATAEAVGVCPGCGTSLEPVDDLTELVGLRSITPGGGPGAAATAHQRLAQRVADIGARRGSPQPDASRWIDDDGSFSPEAVAEALALPQPTTDP